MDIPDDITIPPPSIKAIVVKTVQYIQRNGPEFEQKVKESNSKFTFLKESDPFHEYYQYVLKHLPLEEDNQKDENTAVESVPPLDFLLKDQPTITLKDLEIVKLTAQYVAHHGDADSVRVIRERYMSEPVLFGFTHEGHKWFKLFQTLVRQYKLVIDGECEMLDVDEMVERAKKRAQYEESIRAEQNEKEREEDEKRLKFTSVNWTDFVIVETIKFEEVDLIAELAPPVTIEELQLRSLDAKSKQLTQVDVKDSEEGINIREFGATRMKQHHQSKEKLIQCPFSGKMIPEKNFERHIQILLRDPKYAEEKKKYESKVKNSNLTSDDVVRNIKALFGSKQEPEENKRQKVLWDGYQASKDFVKQQNRATSEELEEYKRKQRQPEIGPRRQ